MIKYLIKIILMFCVVDTDIYHQNTINHLLSFSWATCHEKHRDNTASQYPLSYQSDTNERLRSMLFDEIRIKHPNKQVIIALQDALNGRMQDSVKRALLSDEENLILYIFLHRWDSVLKIIPHLYPYKVNLLSLEGEEIYVSVNGNSAFVPIQKSKFVNSKICTSISNSLLSDEKKEFLNLFIHSYFGYQRLQNNIKLRRAYKTFKKKYTNSEYLKYISLDNRLYYKSNWYYNNKK